MPNLNVIIAKIKKKNTSIIKIELSTKLRAIFLRDIPYFCSVTVVNFLILLASYIRLINYIYVYIYIINT